MDKQDLTRTTCAKYALTPDELGGLMTWLASAPAAEVKQVDVGLYSQASRREGVEFIIAQVVQMLECGQAMHGGPIKALVERGLLPERWAA